MAAVKPKRMTAAEFEARYADKDGRAELIHGEVIDPFRQQVSVHRADGAAQTLTVNDTLSGEDVLPGFELPIRHIFRRVRTFEP